MGYTKRQFITEAYSELGMADYVFDLSPEQMQSALRRLDAMMADWNGRGIRLNYILPSNPESSVLDDETDVPDYANEAVILNLAIKIAPSHGKQVFPDTKAGAKNALNTVLNHAAMPREQEMPTNMPLGAGYKNTISTFAVPVVDPLLDAPTESLGFE